MTPADALKLAEQSGAKMVDFKFVDLLGIWQHTTMPISKLSAEVFKDGYFFDGSSIRGWQPIHASDMIFIPDADSAFMDPFFSVPTLSLACDIVDAITHQPIPWALVEDDPGGPPPFFRTDAGYAGDFELVTLAEPHRIRVSAPGYYPLRVEIGRAWFVWMPRGNEKKNIDLLPLHSEVTPKCGEVLS